MTLVFDNLRTFHAYSSETDGEMDPGIKRYLQQIYRNWARLSSGDVVKLQM